MFPESPIFTSSDPLSDEERRKRYQEILDASSSEASGYYGFSSYSLNYEENNAPNLEDVKTGGGGLPASSFSPNPSSPGPGSYNAATQPAFDGEIKNIDTISNFGTGLGGLVSPATTSKNISKSKIGEYISGRSFAGSDGRS